MDKHTKFKLISFLAWDYDREEAYLNAMSNRGWQLERGGMMHHSYVKEDKCYRYKLDYNPNISFERSEGSRYWSMFEEQGWEYINSTFNGWHYFRKEYIPGSDEMDYEIYTDDQSLQEMLNRWNKLAMIFLIFYAVMSISNICRFIEEPSLHTGAMLMMVILCIILFTSGIISMKRKRLSLNNYILKAISGSEILLIGFCLTLILVILSVIWN